MKDPIPAEGHSRRAPRPTRVGPRDLVFGAIAAISLCGCFRHDYAVSGTLPEPSPSYREWRHNLVNGLISLDDDVSLRAACPQGVSRIEDGMSFPNAILYVLTATLYAPTTIEVYCQLPEVRSTGAVPQLLDPAPTEGDRGAMSSDAGVPSHDASAAGAPQDASSPGR